MGDESYLENRPYPEKFGWALKPAREAAGLTIRQLAEKAGIHWVTLSALENRRKEPTTGTLWKLSQALKLEFRFNGFHWSTGPVGEAGELRDALTALIKHTHPPALGSDARYAASVAARRVGLLWDDDVCCWIQLEG